MTGPIKPSDVQAPHDSSLPEEVFQVFNDLIRENWDGNQAKVMQAHAVTRIASDLKIRRDEVFDRKLLNVEGIYRKQGWVVEYDKPAYNESYEAYFIFRKRPGKK
jgi:hypothetical protein